MSEEEGVRQVHTFCRVCEPACGLVAEVRQGELQKLRPDRTHPVSQGFACHKGLLGVEIHADPDRVDHPLKRNERGELEPVSWDAAISEIALRIRALVDEHGPESFAPYIGNPTAFNTLVGPAIGGLLGQLGVRRSFSSGTQDCANKFAGGEAVFGSSTMHPVPDLPHTDLFISFGANPRVSHASFMSLPDPVRALREVVGRGARVYHVNPVEIESESTGAGETLLVRPDTDVYLLAALIHEVDVLGGFDEDVVAQHGKNVEELRRFVARYPADRVADVVGLTADRIRELAGEVVEAESCALHMSTGANMGRQGTLAYWLLQVLSFVTGNLDRRGGNILSVGFYESARAGRRDFSQSFRSTEYGDLRKGALPGALLPDYIEQEENPVRGMIVLAGNPVLSIGGEERLRAAMEQLDLLVVIDLYTNATAAYADFVLPSADAFERADINITGLGLQTQPYIQYTDRVVEPRHERREEWWILGRIAQALGFSSPFDGLETGGADTDREEPEGLRANLWSRIDHMLGGRGLSLDDVRAEPQGLVFEGLTPGRFYSDFLQTEDRRVDCCPEPFGAALERCEAIFEELESAGPAELKLISRRDPYMHNSWYANIERMKRGDRDRNHLFMNPEDATERGLEPQGKVRITSEWGQVDVTLRFDEKLRRGVVALTHGWGNDRTPGMRVAHRTPGVNPNALLPSGEDAFEPLSSQAFMTGIPVEIVGL